MASWGELAAVRPDLASAGRELLYQHGVGLAYLGTIRRDGGPRLHPMCPLMAGAGLYAFIIASPKQADLLRDGRYALHSFPRPDNEDAFYLTGQVTPIADRSVRAELSDQFVAERAQFGVPAPADADALFEFAISRCMLTRTKGHGDPAPEHLVWSGRA